MSLKSGTNGEKKRSTNVVKNPPDYCNMEEIKLKAVMAHCGAYI